MKIETNSNRIRIYGQFCIETLHYRHNGIECSVVCLSEYLPLRSVYILVIKVEGFVSQTDYESSPFFLLSNVA